MDIRTKDYLTTALFVTVATIVFFTNQILQVVPASILIVVTIILGAVSVYYANNRLTFQTEIEKFMGWKYVQYIITILIIVAPILKTYESQIVGSVPTEVGIFIAPALALLLQYAGGKREYNAVVQAQEALAQVPQPSPEAVPAEDEGA